VPNATVTVAADGTITVTPNAGFEGNIDVPYTIADPDGATASAIHRVAVPNAPPIAQDNAYITNEDTASVIGNALTDTDASAGTDTDPNGDPLTVTPQTGVAGSAGGIFSIDSAGNVTFDPNGDFESLAVGESATTTLSYEISDSDGDTDTAIITVTVQGANDRPVLLDPATGLPYPGGVDSATGLPIDPATGLPIQPIGPQVGTDEVTIAPIDVGSWLSDPDSTDVLGFSATGLPAGLTIDPVSGIITGTPGSSASQGGPNSDGVYIVEVTTIDSNGGVVTSTFTYTIVNPPPVAQDNIFTVADPDTNELLGNLLTDDTGQSVDTDPDGDSLSVIPQTMVMGSNATRQRSH